MTMRVPLVLLLLLGVGAAPSVCDDQAPEACYGHPRNERVPTQSTTPRGVPFTVTSIGGTTADAFDVSPNCVAPLERDALRGSLRAAKRLCDYHATVTDAANEMAYWCEMQAVNSAGDAQSEYGAGLIMSSCGGSRGRQRAVFWLKKAEAHGMEAASAPLAKLLRELGE